MNQNCIVMPHIKLELTDGFQKRLAFDITNCSSDLDNGNLVFLR